jgi:hypothetical protein
MKKLKSTDNTDLLTPVGTPSPQSSTCAPLGSNPKTSSSLTASAGPSNSQSKPGIKNTAITKDRFVTLLFQF